MIVRMILVLFAVAIGVALPSAMADVPSPLAQYNTGVPISDIQCRDSKILMETNRNTPACLNDTSASEMEKRGWIIIEQKAEPIIADVTSSEILPPQEVTLSVVSSEEFVDDGREIKRSTLQKSPAPAPWYERITDSEINPDDIDSDGLIRLPQSAQHEKYSVNPGVGFYIQDWMPTHIPDGQKLLYADQECYPSGDCDLRINFVPTTFVLHENVTNYDLDVSKGFNVLVHYGVEPLHEIEDSIEHAKEGLESQPDNYGGFRDMTRDGKTVLAYEGGNALNHYQAVLNFRLDEHTSLGVVSNYHTLNELIPIFNSIGN